MTTTTDTSSIGTNQTKRPLPPMARGEVGLGILREFFRDKTGTLTRLAREYGPVVRFRIGPTPFTLITDPADIRRVYATPEQYNKDSDAFRQMSTWLGAGLSTSPGGDGWRRHRRFATPAFKRQSLLGLLPTVQSALDDHLKSWGENVVGKEVDVHHEMRRISLRLVGEALMSVDLVGEYKKVGEAFADASDEVGFRAMHPFRFVDALPLPRNRRYREANLFQDSVINDLVKRRRNGQNHQRHDLLQLLLDSRDDAGGKLDDQEMLDEVKTFFAAGHFTTAACLNWTFYLLATNPDVRAKTVEEIDRVLGDAPMDEARLEQLPMLQRVIDESLRLFPPSWIVSRMVAEEGELGGFRIPKGEQLMISSYVVQRDPKHWEDPERFDPDRFLPERAPKSSQFIYFPFGGGPRVCIGSNFALMEMQTIIATILRRYDFELSSRYQFGLDPGLSLRPQGGMPVRFTQRRH
jgi:cytochrome P450